MRVSIKVGIKCNIEMKREVMTTHRLFITFLKEDMYGLWT